MTTRTDHYLWPGLTYVDVPAGRRWLAALGFEEGILVETADGSGLVQHSEMLWPEGGRVMLSSHDRADDTFTRRPGTGNVYVVCDHPDEVWARAEALGATVLREMEESDYGSRGFSVADPEGNAWSFGTYAGG